MDDEDDVTCKSCGRRPATWHLTEIVGGQPIQHHLCEECYSKEARAEAATISELIAAVVPELKEMVERECPSCGMNYLEFRQTMRLGCPKDYETFDKALEHLLERIHGAAHHTGKVPATAGSAEALRSRLRSLRKQQKEAIALEDYEQAARLRDRIKDLEEHGLDLLEN